jgi:hypothetical protein
MVDKSVGDLKTMADDKIAMEDKLFLQFKEVLNSKKRKIALLRQELENLRWFISCFGGCCRFSLMSYLRFSL